MKFIRSAVLLLLLFPSVAHVFSMQAQQSPSKELVIFDTDIGDDIDDVLALTLLLHRPRFRVLGITTAWGDTRLRGRLVDRLLEQVGRSDIPVAIGPETHSIKAAPFSQRAWAERQPERKHPDAVAFLLDSIRQHPQEITLIAVAPLTNIAAAFERDPVTFRGLKRIVLMGGSIHRGYGDFGFTPAHGPDPEYNIAMDPAAAKNVFASGVPLFVMPLDSTQILLDEEKRMLLFTHSSPSTDALTLLYQQWSHVTHMATPTMFDAVAVAFADQPDLCPVEPALILIDDQGYTRLGAGTANSFVCLNSDSDQFFRYYVPALLDDSGAWTKGPAGAER